MGVDIFFVLSGFLITKILFDSRIKAEKWNVSIFTVIKNFYIRRTLRIFPIYYLTIFVLLIFHNHTGTNIQSSFIYFATYTSNFYFFKIQHWDGMISHLWSLAVEEQFYLFWPWIILFANKKHFLKIVVCFILIGIISQYTMMKVNLYDILTFNCFDAFGLGALLAWQITFRPKNLEKFYRRLSIFAIIAFFIFVLNVIQKRWEYVPLRTLIAVVSLWVITYIVLNQENGQLKLKFIFNNRVLIFLGKISYGLYLYHLILPSILNKYIFNKYFDAVLPDFLRKNYLWHITLIVDLLILVLAAWLSFVLIEKRFLRLKKFFEYQDEPGLQNTLIKVPN